MAPDLDGPGWKSVFKVSNLNKLPYSQNTPEGCAFCLAKRKPGDPPLQLCSGCRSVRFCNREHQIAFWPSHKDFCKEQKKANAAMQHHVSHGPQHNCGLPPLPQRKVILEDWTELHRHSIEQAIASALHIARPAIDLKKKYAHFTLDYRPESSGNPSTAFSLRSAKFRDDPPSGVPISLQFTIFRDNIAQADAKEGITKDPTFVASLICLYEIDSEFIWLSASSIYKDDLRMAVEFNHEDWYITLKTFTDKGLVFRKTGRGRWTPGLMDKQGSKHWVWKEKTIEELAGHGIPIMKR